MFINTTTRHLDGRVYSYEFIYIYATTADSISEYNNYSRVYNVAAIRARWGFAKTVKYSKSDTPRGAQLISLRPEFSRNVACPFRTLLFSQDDARRRRRRRRMRPDNNNKISVSFRRRGITAGGERRVEYYYAHC